MKNNTNPPKQNIWTIPNILSIFRLCLIPVIMWLYGFKANYPATLAVLALSGLTDIADGFIARKFNMISDFGKMLDPVADKITQFCMLLCLTDRFPNMWFPVVLLAIKEITTGVMSLLAIRKSNAVKGAVWHGKVTTVLLYVVMGVHLVWFQMPAAVSNALILLCTGMMVLSAVLYGIRNMKTIRPRENA